MPGYPTLQQLARNQQFALIEGRDGGQALLTTPDPQQVLPPFLGSACFQRQFALPERDSYIAEALLQSLHIRGLPHLEVERIVGLIVTIVQGDQVVRPGVAFFDVIEEVRKVLKAFP